MDNIYDRYITQFDSDAEPETMRDPIQDTRPERDFPAMVPERSELPRRRTSQDELDFIPQQRDEF